MTSHFTGTTKKQKMESRKTASEEVRLQTTAKTGQRGCSGRPFQIREAATGKARSPMVDNRIRRTTSDGLLSVYCVQLLEHAAVCLVVLLLCHYYFIYYCTCEQNKWRWTITQKLDIQFLLFCFTLHAFVTSRLDYCNSILYGASAVHIRPLQNVLNAAARLILRKRKYDHITAAIRDLLHWLPVQQRIEYKLCVLVYKCLLQTAPIYLSELCIPVATSAGRSHLRSAVKGCLVVITAGLRTMDSEISHTLAQLY